MKITKDKHTIEISLGTETLTFGGLSRVRKKKLSDRGDEMVMDELNRLWSMYDEETQAAVFQCYKDLDAIATESMDVLDKLLPPLVKRIVELHPASVFKQLYPIDRVWIPEDLQHNFERMSPNYTEGMTYLVGDYYELIIYALQLKPLLPVFGLLQVYDTQRTVRRKSVEERERTEREQLARRRGTIQRTIQAFDYISETELGQSPAVSKMRAHLADLVKNFQKDIQRGGSSIETVAAFCGFGTDKLDDYMMAFAVVNVLSQQIVGAIRTHNLGNSAQLVAVIHYAVKSEVETGLANKLTTKAVVSKVSIRAVTIGGERGKFSSIDLVSARSDAPIGESIRSELQFTHPPFQRSLYDALNIDLSFEACKQLVNYSLQQDGAFYEVQEWLVALVMHRFADHRTYKDMDPMPMQAAVGWAQAVYLHYGMYDIARLLACRVSPRDPNLLGYIVNPFTNVSKADVDRYYPQGYMQYRHNLHPQNINVLYQSIQEFVTLMNRYEYELALTDVNVANLLRCSAIPAGEEYIPDPTIGASLVEMSVIQAKNKLKELAFFTN